MSRPSRSIRKALFGLATCLVALTLLVACAGVYLEHRISGQVQRIPAVFAGLHDRPSSPHVDSPDRPVNILFLGTDRRSGVPTTGTRARAASWLPGAQRTDTMMLVHVAGDRQNVTVVSIPRDSWVEVPGHGMSKVNAAFSYGGPSLTIATVEHLTGLRIDHLAVIDWDGFRALTDALGGVTVHIPRTVYDSARDKTWTAGWHRLDGAQALLYVRQRHGLPGGDFDRVRRQQNLLRLLLEKITSQHLWSHPLKSYKILDSVTKNLSIDSGWSVKEIGRLAHQLAGLDRDSVHFTTAPVGGTGRVGAQDVVFLDRQADSSLWRALRGDRAPQWFAAHPDDRLGTRVP